MKADRPLFPGRPQSVNPSKKHPGLLSLLSDLLDRVGREFRLALLSTWKHRVHSLTVITTIALATASGSVIFSVVDRILFRATPYSHEDTLVSVGVVAPIDSVEFLPSGTYFQWKNSGAFPAMASWSGVTDCSFVNEVPVGFVCARVEWDFLQVLGVPLQLGRDFEWAEDRPGAPRVAILSHDLWSSRFGRSREVIGTEFSSEGGHIRVVGVLPHDFKLPNLQPFDMLVPQSLSEGAHSPKATHMLRAFARLQPDTTLEQAHAKLQSRFLELLRLVPPNLRNEVSLRIRPIREYHLGSARMASWLLLAGIIAVILVACANVAGLLYARDAARKQERAIRHALGATTARSLAESTAQNLMLGFAGGIVGLGLAGVLLEALIRLAPDGIPYLDQASINWRVLVFAIGASVLATILPSVSIALQRPQLGTLSGVRTTRSGLVLRQLLIIAQVSISMFLLSLAGLLVRSFVNIQNEQIGIRPEQAFTAEIVLGAHYPRAEQRQRFFGTLETRILQLPGVDAVGVSDTLPPDGPVRSKPFSIVQIYGRPIAEEGQLGTVNWRAVTPGYFRALGIPIVRGRPFVDDDRKSSDKVVILSERLAGALFPGAEPLSQHVRFGPEEPWWTIVGVAGNVRNEGLTASPGPEFYLVRKDAPDLGLGALQTEATSRRAVLVVRSDLTVEAIGRSIQFEIAKLDPTLPVNVEAMEEIIARLRTPSRFNATVLGYFSVLSLLMASVGIYGLISFVVEERNRELGIRMALGATRWHIARVILSHVLVWTVTGAVIGLFCAFLAGDLVESLLYRVKGIDLLTQLVTIGVLLLTSLIAATRPIVRASRVDPATVLRYE